MATYYGLSSLEGLAVGDVVEYSGVNGNSVSFNEWEIDFAGYTVDVVMEGARNQSSGGKGGRVRFRLDSSLLEYPLIYRNHHSALAYKVPEYTSANFENFRIAVPGDTGYPGIYNGATINAGGGGSNGVGGSAGNGNVGGSYARGNAGKMNAGGTNNGGETALKGGFGYGGVNPNTGASAANGGYGWYGGGAGSGTSSTDCASGGGGSGFVLGDATLSYAVISSYAFNPQTSSYYNAFHGTVTDIVIERSVSSMANGQEGRMGLIIVATGGVTVGSIQFSSLPTKTRYYVNQTFNPAGLEVVAIYKDGTTATLSSNDYTIIYPDMSTAGTKSVTVLYQNQSNQFDITVLDVYVQGISLSGNYQTSFNVGDTFTSAGLVVSAYYSNNTEAITNNYSISAPNMSTTGSQIVRVTYTGSDAVNTIRDYYYITIVDPNAHPVITYYDAITSRYRGCELYYYQNGFVKCDVYYYNGTEFVEIFSPV